MTTSDVATFAQRWYHQKGDIFVETSTLSLEYEY